MLIKHWCLRKFASRNNFFHLSIKSVAERRMKKFHHILSLFAEDVILPDSIESNLLHNSLESFSKFSLWLSSSDQQDSFTAQLLARLASWLAVSKDGSDRICATAAFINL